MVLTDVAAGGAALGLPDNRLVAVASIPQGVDSGLGEGDDVAVLPGRIFAHTLRGESVQAARSVLRALDAGQQQEAAVLHAGGPSSFASRSGPAEVRVAFFQMEARAAEAQQRRPRAVVGASGGTEHFPDEARVVQERSSGDSFGPAGHLGATDQLEPHGVERVLFRRMRDLRSPIPPHGAARNQLVSGMN